MVSSWNQRRGTIEYMDLRIAPATVADVPSILRLVKQLAVYEKLAHEMVSTAEDFQRALFGPQRHVEALIAFVEDTPVAFALYFYTFSTFLGKRGIYLEDIFVEPAWRGQGIGSALLQRLAAIAREQNCGRMEWSVLTWNQPSIDFYHRLGAVTMEEWRTFRLTGEALDALADRV
jgi:GNAT superfamily N-acetyltransferase